MAREPENEIVSPPFSREASLGYLVNHLARLFARALEKRLARHGVALGQFPPLLILWDEENITQSEIARRLDIEQPTVANTLKRMQRDGLIVPVADPGNRRRVLIRLTDRARALRPLLIGEAETVNALAGATLSADETAAFAAVLNRMRQALARQAD